MGVVGFILISEGNFMKTEKLKKKIPIEKRRNDCLQRFIRLFALVFAFPSLALSLVVVPKIHNVIIMYVWVFIWCLYLSFVAFFNGNVRNLKETVRQQEKSQQ